MRNWMSTRVVGALVTGLLVGGAAATGVTALAAGGEPLPAAPATCVSGTPDTGGTVTFGLGRPHAA